MPHVALTPALRSEYDRLFEACDARPNRRAAVDALAGKILAARPRYAAAGAPLGVPWAFVGVIHNMEASLSFTRHLHNGDPLSRRTVRVPAGRPPRGEPPFTWETSAGDALAMKRLDRWNDWSVAGTLYQLERYNGWGYRLYHPHVLTPYLWSFSCHYTSGKYIADGTWSERAISQQCGAAVLLRRLAETAPVDLPDQPAPIAPPAPPSPIQHGPLISRFSMRRLTHPAERRKAEALQRWINTFPGIFVRVDGIPGKRTSDAYCRITGHRLPGDPRPSA